MTRELYFVCASPGTTGNFIGKMIKNAISTGTNSEIILLENSFNAPTPEVLTADFFFDNIIVPEDDSVVINSPFIPNYEKIFSRFSDAKVVVVTHSLTDCLNLAKTFFKSYYVFNYEFGADIHFKKIIDAYPHLFKNPDVTPNQLTLKEQNIFIKILEHQKVVDGFHSLEVPTNPNVLEIAFRDIHFNNHKVESQLEQFIGKTFSAADKVLNRELSNHFITQYFRSSSVDKNVL